MKNSFGHARGSWPYSSQFFMAPLYNPCSSRLSWFHIPGYTRLKNSPMVTGVPLSPAVIRSCSGDAPTESMMSAAEGGGVPITMIGSPIYASRGQLLGSLTTHVCTAAAPPRHRLQKTRDTARRRIVRILVFTKIHFLLMMDTYNFPLFPFCPT